MLGILLVVLASVFYGVSASMQRHSVGSLERFGIRKMARHRVWIFSIFLGAIGIILYIFALTFESLVTIQPILSISIIIPIISGVVFFKEKLVKRQWISILFILAGIILVSLY
jgi:drug/metabolite transporter (DMT)-like permease